LSVAGFSRFGPPALAVVFAVLAALGAALGSDFVWANAAKRAARIMVDANKAFFIAQHLF
jgi:hypothetical protein